MDINANDRRRRIFLGGAIGFTFYAISLLSTLLRYVFNPMVERASFAAFVALSLYFFLFVAVGMFAGYLGQIRPRLWRFISIGALIGALIWSYLVATWPLTGRASTLTAPQATVFSATLIGAALGALGGALLSVVGMIRRLLEGRNK